MDRVTELLAANSRIVLKGRDLKRMLEKARDQFAFYAREHREKANNTNESQWYREGAAKKAETNEAMVREIQGVLDDYHMVEKVSNLSASPAA